MTLKRNFLIFLGIINKYYKEWNSLELKENKMKFFITLLLKLVNQIQLSLLKVR